MSSVEDTNRPSPAKPSGEEEPDIVEETWPGYFAKYEFLKNGGGAGIPVHRYHFLTAEEPIYVDYRTAKLGSPKTFAACVIIRSGDEYNVSFDLNHSEMEDLPWVPVKFFMKPLRAFSDCVAEFEWDDGKRTISAQFRNDTPGLPSDLADGRLYLARFGLTGKGNSKAFPQPKDIKEYSAEDVTTTVANEDVYNIPTGEYLAMMGDPGPFDSTLPLVFVCRKTTPSLCLPHRNVFVCAFTLSAPARYWLKRWLSTRN